MPSSGCSRTTRRFGRIALASAAKTECGMRRFDRAVVQPAEEALQPCLVELARGNVLTQRRFDLADIALAAGFATRDPDDPAVWRQLILAMEQRRYQLAPSEIAGAAEHHEIKRVEICCLSNHRSGLHINVTPIQYSSGGLAARPGSACRPCCGHPRF